MSEGEGCDAWVVQVLTQVEAITRARSLPCYLVGGWVRDQLLGRAPASLNVDLAVPSGAIPLSRALAESLRGTCVPLDETAGSARVVLTLPQAVSDQAGPQEASRLELDVSDFRGPTLEVDLGHRDFTINAIAVALPDWLKHPRTPHPLVDPLGGQGALVQRVLSPCFPGTFEEDPVRILRGFRFVAQLGFTLEAAAWPLMQRAMASLSGVSGERLRDELMAICDTDRASIALRELNRLGALEAVVPELGAGRGMDQGDFHHLDVLEHQLETVSQADRFLADFAEFSEPLREPLARYCREEPVERRSRKALIKLAGLLHDVGKPAHKTIEPDGEVWFHGHEQTGARLAAGIVERLRLSNREATMVCRIVLHHLRPGFLSREPQLTRRAVYRFFKDLGEDGPGCLLNWWADRMATRGTKSRVDQIDEQRDRLEELLNAYFFKAEEAIKPVRLVDGRRLMETFRLTPGPLIGRLLAMIEEAQAEGRIHTADDALELARAHLSEQ